MLRKISIQLVLLLAAFFATWYGLSRIDFIDEDEIEAVTQEKEKKLGDLILTSITRAGEEIKDERVRAVIDTIKTRICQTRRIRCEDIKIHIVRQAEVNAFALPGNHIVIYTGLIEYAQNAEQVAGVMAHEIGHLDHNHVMKKLVKEIGLEMLFAIAGGDAGFEIIRQTGKTLSSTAFDRANETEADNYAVTALAAAHIDPQHLSDFFFRLSHEQNFPANLAWLSTHPASGERALEIIQTRKELAFDAVPLLNLEWSAVKAMLSPEDDAGGDWPDNSAAEPHLPVLLLPGFSDRK